MALGMALPGMRALAANAGASAGASAGANAALLLAFALVGLCAWTSGMSLEAFVGAVFCAYLQILARNWYCSHILEKIWNVLQELDADKRPTQLTNQWTQKTRTNKKKWRGRKMA